MLALRSRPPCPHRLVGSCSCPVAATFPALAPVPAPALVLSRFWLRLRLRRVPLPRSVPVPARAPAPQKVGEEMPGKYPNLWRRDAAGGCAEEVSPKGRGGNARNYPNLWRPLSTAQSIPPCHPVSPVCFPALRFPVHFVHAPSAGLPIRLALPAHTSEGRGGNARNCPDLWRRDAAGCCVEEVSPKGRGGNARNCPNLWRWDAAESCAEEVSAEGRGKFSEIFPYLCVL